MDDVKPSNMFVLLFIIPCQWRFRWLTGRHREKIECTWSWRVKFILIPRESKNLENSVSWEPSISSQKIFSQIRQYTKKKFTHRSITSANPFATHQHLALGLGVSFSLASEMRCKPSGVRVLIDKLSLRAARTAHCACKRLSGAQCDPRCEEGNIGRHLLQLTVQIPPPPRQPPKWT